MFRKIKIENKEIPMVINGATLLEYRRFFETDMLGDYLQLSNAIQKTEFEKFDSLTLARMMWVCAYGANNQIEDFEKWLSKFNSPFVFYDSLSDFIKLMESGLHTNVKPKKSQARKKNN